MIRCSKFSLSPACHNRVTWLATSAQQLMLLAVIRSKQLCPAPRSWRHNATPWWCHLQNITGFRNLELDTLSNVKSTGKYWLNFVFLTSRDNPGLTCGQPSSRWLHYCDVVMGTMASQITSLTIVYLTVYSGADQRKHQSSASLAFVQGIHWGPGNSPHKWPVTRKMFPFDDVMMSPRDVATQFYYCSMFKTVTWLDC